MGDFHSINLNMQAFVPKLDKIPFAQVENELNKGILDYESKLATSLCKRHSQQLSR